VVAPLNAYAVGTLSAIGYAYVQTAGEQPPRIDDMDPTTAAHGERVTLSGVNLDVPGRIRLNALICPIVSATETEIVFVVPAGAQNGMVFFENLMNTVTAGNLDVTP
jgi:hypothetical protein